MHQMLLFAFSQHFPCYVRPVAEKKQARAHMCHSYEPFQHLCEHFWIIVGEEAVKKSNMVQMREMKENLCHEWMNWLRVCVCVGNLVICRHILPRWVSSFSVFWAPSLLSALCNNVVPKEFRVPLTQWVIFQRKHLMTWNNIIQLLY